MPADRTSQFITVPRARFWTIGPNGHAVKVSISPGHSLIWSHPDQDGQHITKVWRHQEDCVCQVVVSTDGAFTRHVAPVESCAARHFHLPHVPSWRLTAFSGARHD